MLDFGTIATGVGLGASALSGLFGGGGGSDTGSSGSDALWWAQAETSAAQQRASKMYQRAYEEAIGHMRNYLDPYAAAGGRGLNALINAVVPERGLTPEDMISGLPPGAKGNVVNWLMETPMYQVPLQEGLKAIQRAASAKGMLLSPATLKGLQDYSSQYALSNALAPAVKNYQEYMRYITGLSQRGQQAATDLGQGLASMSMEKGKLKGAAQLAQAQIQAGTAGGLSSSYANQAQLGTAQNYLDQRNLASALGGLGSVIGNLPWDKFGNVFSGGQNRSSFGGGVNFLYGPFGGGVA